MHNKLRPIGHRGVNEVHCMSDSGGWATMRTSMSAFGPVIQAREASEDAALNLDVLEVRFAPRRQLGRGRGRLG